MQVQIQVIANDVLLITFIVDTEGGYMLTIFELTDTANQSKLPILNFTVNPKAF